MMASGCCGMPYRGLFKLVILGGVGAVVVMGQSLRIVPSKATGDTSGPFTVMLELSPGKEPVALQWEFAVSPVVAIRKTDIEIGRTAKLAGKSLTCVAKASNPGSQVCVLAGGQKVLGAGPIAVIKCRARAHTHREPIRVAIQNALGVSVDLKRIDIRGVDSVIQ